MARIATVMTWASHEADFRAALGVATGEDDYLEALLDAATEAADTFIDRDWTDDDGADIDIPKRVIQGVYEWSRVVRGATNGNGAPVGVSSVKVGDNSVSYAASSVTRVDLSDLALSAARMFWWSAKKNKGR